LCKIEIDVHDIYSPNLKDSEIIVRVHLSKLLWLFDSKLINDIFKFFRNTKSYDIKDVESLNVQLMD
jgi:hypothetical protein